MRLRTVLLCARTSMTVLAILLVSLGSWSVLAGPITLRAPIDTPMGATPLSVVAGDFNGDGKLDVASANHFGDAAGVRLGDGKGGFAPPVTYATGARPVQIITGFFNNDGFLDLATANKQDNNITVLINNGSGVFTPTSYPAGVGPVSLTTADFNNDGRADIVAASQIGSALAICFANAGGGFNSPTLIGIANSQVQAVSVGLVNADANFDIVTANPGLNSISVLTGDGAGNFSAPASFTTGVNSVPTTLSLGDFTGDNKLDAIVSTNQSNVTVLAGNGAGAFAVSTTFPTSGVSAASVLRDVNGDGNLDIVANCNVNSLVRVIYGTGSGGLAGQQDIVTTNKPRSTAIADFNGDGKLDLATVSETLGSLSVALFKGGEFPTAKAVGGGSPTLVDLNNDGLLDLLFGGLSVRLGTGAGNFASAVNSPNTNSGNDYVVGDINNDGRPDIVTSGGVGIGVRLNNGSGAFPTVIALTTTQGKLGLGDFNNDNKVDLIVGIDSAGPNNLQIYQGDGAGNFILAATATASGTPSDLAIADFNGDGKPDVVTVVQPGAGPGGITVQIWNGANTFAAPSAVSGAGCSPNQPPAIADFNHDGILDLGAACGGGIGVFTNNGSGAFTLFSLYAAPASASGSVAADFNRDGNMDIATTGVGQLSVGYGSASGLFTPTNYSIGGPGTWPTAGDVTGDGVPDLAYSSSLISGSYLILSSTFRGGVTADFDGDGRTDLSVFRPSTGIWYIIRSFDNTFYGVQFGQNGDVPVPGDYDADGKTDIAVFRPSGGLWYILRSSDGSFFAQQHGTSGDIPVPADYNGDGTTNIAVYRPSTNFWYTSTNPATNYDAVQFGAAGDIPTQADFDGDGRADIAVFRPSAGIWYSLRTSQGFHQTSFGISGDRPAPLDYDGDGKANIAVFRPSNATWYTSTNPATNFGAIQWGLGTDVMVPGYYDGDGRADVGVYRTGDWYVLKTATPSYDHFYFGSAGDIPIPLAFLPQ